MAKNSKLPKFLEAMKTVLEDERSVILTDCELRIATNHLLKRKDRVALSTFEFWKSPTINKKSPENIEGLDDEMVEEFREVLAYARVNQKMNLTDALMDSKNKNQWGSTWILERKYTDLKLQKHQAQVQQPLISITASSDEHKSLIQNILNGEPIELEPYKELDIPSADYIEIIDKKNINPQINNE